MATTDANDRDLPPRVRRARTLARILDDYYLDPLLGFFVPQVGDVIGASTGLYLVVVAFREKLPPIVIARMLLNLAVDAAFGAIPLAGDLFDAVFKANRRNLRLLEARTAAVRSRPIDWIIVGLAALALLATLALPIVLAILVLSWLAG